ncbi:MAG: NAD(P)-dependent oxidoreductase [Archangium sp.]
MPFTILVPEGTELDVAFPGEVKVVRYDVAKPIPDVGADGLVVWGNPPAHVKEAAAKLKTVRWVQTLAAGPDVVLQAGFDARVAVTSGRGLHDATVCEHTLALTLAVLRRVPGMVAAQNEKRWADELGGLKPLHDETAVRTLIGARVLVWGFGSIAAKLAPVLSALGATVKGAATTAGTRHGFEVVSDVKPLLPETDVLISLLPDLPETRGVLNAEVFAKLPKRAVVVNVGRGAVLDEAALLKALQTGEISGAALDVFVTEPLPRESPLWSAPNLLISPHAAGGRPIGAGKLIAENVNALLDGRELRNRVER